jgi:hypothetical protein
MDIKETWEPVIAANILRVGELIKPGPGPTEREILGEMGIGSEGVQEAIEEYPAHMAIPPEMLQTALGEQGYRLFQDGPPYPAVLVRRIQELGLDYLLDE